jgi:hypothetical protein
MSNPILDSTSFMQIDTRHSLDPHLLMHSLHELSTPIEEMAPEYEMYSEYTHDIEMRDPVDELIRSHEEAINMDLEMIQEETYLRESVLSISREEYLHRLEHIVVRKYSLYKALMDKIHSLGYYDTTN